MTEASDHPVAASRWTCPFCPLLCDEFAVRVGAAAGTLDMIGGDCPVARAALSAFGTNVASATPLVDGRPCDLDAACEAAARVLADSGQPLFGGLGTDVAGARALYRLACDTGAICDHAAGAGLMHGLRALQDRGQFTTTLAEVRTRADLIVFVGALPTDVAPLIAQRCGIGDPQVPQREVVVLGAAPGDDATLAAWSKHCGVSVQWLPLQGDLFDTVSMLAALVARTPVASAPPALQSLAQRLRAARYAVLVGAPPKLPRHGSLIVEAVHLIVGTLNRGTRAAALWVGGGNGAATVNQVFAWLGGLPLRSRAGPRGLEHEPLVFDAARLIADGAVDALLWVSSFGAGAGPLANRVPMVVLGHPAHAASSARDGLRTVFIPVATPGIGSAGHAFRTDGTVLMPLEAVCADRLPTVSQVVQRIGVALRSLREGRPA